MARRHFIVVGDTTTAGGKVLTGAQFFSIQSLAGDQRPQAFVGDQVECGQCGPTTIISGVSHMTFDGRQAAVEGCSLACGHKLVSTEQRLSWTEDSISDGALRPGSTRANFAGANNKDPAGGLDVSSRFAGKTGVLIFDVSGWGDASGHVTLWNGRDCGDTCYFVHDQPGVRTIEVMFWELK